MILEIKRAAPVISFGLGLTEAVALSQKKLTVWLDTLYNEAAYTFAVSSLGADVIEQVSNYQYELTYNNPGSYKIIASVTPQKSPGFKGESLMSNELTVTIE